MKTFNQLGVCILAILIFSSLVLASPTMPYVVQGRILIDGHVVPFIQVTVTDLSTRNHLFLTVETNEFGEFIATPNNLLDSTGDGFRTGDYLEIKICENNVACSVKRYATGGGISGLNFNLLTDPSKADTSRPGDIVIDDSTDEDNLKIIIGAQDLELRQLRETLLQNKWAWGFIAILVALLVIDATANKGRARKTMITFIKNIKLGKYKKK